MFLKHFLPIIFDAIKNHHISLGFLQVYLEFILIDISWILILSLNELLCEVFFSVLDQSDVGVDDYLVTEEYFTVHD